MNKSSYYQKQIRDFLQDNNDSIIGEIVRHHHFATDPKQLIAWEGQINNLKKQLFTIESGDIFFEFSIPRMGKRVDNVLLISEIVFILEYKVGAKEFYRHDKDQAMDYALDLKNFHEASHNKYIIPILIATGASDHGIKYSWHEDLVSTVILSNGNNLNEIIDIVISNISTRHATFAGFSEEKQRSFNQPDWAQSTYKPTPTIVEAAQSLYSGHSVEEISRSDAGAKNLTNTSKCITRVINHSRTNNLKSICFVTGVPGAGKTLAGLNITTKAFDKATEEHAVFLSGNGPLVAVLREALARNECAKSKDIKKSDADQKVSAFIQNIHHFRDEGLLSEKPPIEHVVVFDEAQRAWDQRHAEKFMRQKRGATDFDMSEPEFLISLMDRRDDWATIICLIGGGQEINTGEAGLIEWFNALVKSFPHWDIYHSNQLSHKNYNWGKDLKSKLKHLNATEEKDLHLAVSLRSYRAEKLSDFIGAIIDGNVKAAISIKQKLHDYPIYITRDIERARAWLKSKARGSERFGLVASSGALRLKPEGIYVKNDSDPINWFLNSKEDIRSSYYLEDVATEFDIQGLELDWIGMCWDANFRRHKDEWTIYKLSGTKWQNVKDEYKRTYIANSYRVLLTRARQGMIIFVPKGNKDDHTRPPEFYNETFQFLNSCGIDML